VASATLVPLAFGDKVLYPVALTVDGTLIADIMKGARHFGVGLLDLRAGAVKQIADASGRNDAVLSASGTSRWIVWSMSADTSLDVPHWRLYAYDRRSGRTVTVVVNRNSIERVAPSPVVVGASVLWSTNTPDGKSLAIYGARLSPPAAPRLILRDATSPYVYGNRVYLIRRHGEGNVLTVSTDATLRSLQPVPGVEQVRQYVVVAEGVVYLDRNDANTVFFTPNGAPAARPLTFDPGQESAEGLTAGQGVVGVNHEDVGVLDFVDAGDAVVVSEQEAANHVLLAGCYASWQSQSRGKPVARWLSFC
jgi:hypothetical protein